MLLILRPELRGSISESENPQVFVVSTDGKGMISAVELIQSTCRDDRQLPEP